MGEGRTEDGTQHCQESSPMNLSPNVPGSPVLALSLGVQAGRGPSQVCMHTCPALLPFRGWGTLVVMQAGLPP